MSSVPYIGSQPSSQARHEEEAKNRNLRKQYRQLKETIHSAPQM